MASRCFIFMYFLLPHCVPATWRSRAQTSISSAADAGHPSDPFHLVLGFQSFGYALGFLHLLDRPVEYCTCNCAHFLQVGIQRSLKQHAGIEPRFVIPEVISSPSLSQNADLWTLRGCQTWKQIRSLLPICAAYCLKNYLHSQSSLFDSCSHFTIRPALRQMCEVLFLMKRSSSHSSSGSSNNCALA